MIPENIVHRRSYVGCQPNSCFLARFIHNVNFKCRKLIRHATEMMTFLYLLLFLSYYLAYSMCGGIFFCIVCIGILKKLEFDRFLRDTRIQLLFELYRCFFRGLLPLPTMKVFGCVSESTMELIRKGKINEAKLNKQFYGETSDVTAVDPSCFNKSSNNQDGKLGQSKANSIRNRNPSKPVSTTMAAPVSSPKKLSHTSVNQSNRHQSESMLDHSSLKKKSQTNKKPSATSAGKTSKSVKVSDIIEPPKSVSQHQTESPITDNDNDNENKNESDNENENTTNNNVSLSDQLNKNPNATTSILSQFPIKFDESRTSYEINDNEINFANMPVDSAEYVFKETKNKNSTSQSGSTPENLPAYKTNSTTSKHSRKEQSTFKTNESTSKMKESTSRTKESTSKTKESTSKISRRSSIRKKRRRQIKPVKDSSDSLSKFSKAIEQKKADISARSSKRKHRSIKRRSISKKRTKSNKKIHTSSPDVYTTPQTASPTIENRSSKNVKKHKVLRKRVSRDRKSEYRTRDIKKHEKDIHETQSKHHRKNEEKMKKVEQDKKILKEKRSHMRENLTETRGFDDSCAKSHNKKDLTQVSEPTSGGLNNNNKTIPTNSTKELLSNGNVSNLFKSTSRNSSDKNGLVTAKCEEKTTESY
ncbi:hypothetical protein SNEBB_001841 [Seison nebaliae]|nr:hypothetical protein SNEBB_001841 [Seison nebaliae]